MEVSSDSNEVYLLGKNSSEEESNKEDSKVKNYFFVYIKKQKDFKISLKEKKMKNKKKAQ